MNKLINSIKRSYFLYEKGKTPWPEGEEGLQARDYKRMVGGKWDELGKLQFDFMLSQGLTPQDVLCDVACGSFRAGRLFIKYLAPGNYLGIEKQEVLIREGRKKVIGEALWQEKKPEIVLSDTFEFCQFHKKPKYAIANSLFTHLSGHDIQRCLTNLYPCVMNGCSFFATFFESEYPVFHFHQSHSSRRFEYTKKQMLNFGRKAGWKSEYIGEWKHPVDQKMVCYTKSPTD
jgi:hypothetical protein